MVSFCRCNIYISTQKLGVKIKCDANAYQLFGTNADSGKNDKVIIASIDLSNLDTSNAETMRQMFMFCSNLTSLDLSSFDTSNVTDMDAILGECSKLTTLKVGDRFEWKCDPYSAGSPGKWRGENGKEYTFTEFPSNVAHTYTKIS